MIRAYLPALIVCGLPLRGFISFWIGLPDAGAWLTSLAVPTWLLFFVWCLRVTRTPPRADDTPPAQGNEFASPLTVQRAGNRFCAPEEGAGASWHRRWLARGAVHFLPRHSCGFMHSAS